MKPSDGGYKVVNTDWKQSLPEYFDTFADAFEAQQKWDTRAEIHQIRGDSVIVVWTKDYEDFVCNNIFV